MKRPKVFMGLIEMCAYFTNLKQGFDKLGVQADLYNIMKLPADYRRRRTSARAPAAKAHNAKVDGSGITEIVR